MNKVLYFFTGLAFAVCTSSSIAASTPTPLDNNWVCTTNASGSTDTDDQMKNTAKSAVDSFAFAASNCRDCDKITCTVK